MTLNTTTNKKSGELEIKRAESNVFNVIQHTHTHTHTHTQTLAVTVPTYVIRVNRSVKPVRREFNAR